MIRFEIRKGNEWKLADSGSIHPNGSLIYRLNGVQGHASAGDWRLAQSTLDNPVFKTACREKLSREEKLLAAYREIGHSSY